MSDSAQNVRENTLVVTDNGACGGKIVMWEIHGHTDRAVLISELESRGLSPEVWPSEQTSPAQALVNALRSVAGGRRLLVRPLTRGSHAIVEEAVDVADIEDGEEAQDFNSDLDHTILAKAKVISHKIGTGETVKVPVIESDDDDLKEAITDAFSVERDSLAPNVFSSWMASAIHDSCNAVKLRRAGGMAFVPPSQIERLEAIMESVGVANSEIVFDLIPAMESDEAANAVLRALEREAGEAIAKIEEKMDTGDMGKRALNTQRHSLEGLGEKLKVYDLMLGDALEGIRGRIEDVDVVIGEAILLEEAAKATAKQLTK